MEHIPVSVLENNMDFDCHFNIKNHSLLIAFVFAYKTAIKFNVSDYSKTWEPLI